MTDPMSVDSAPVDKQGNGPLIAVIVLLVIIVGLGLLLFLTDGNKDPKADFECRGTTGIYTSHYNDDIEVIPNDANCGG